MTSSDPGTTHPPAAAAAKKLWGGRFKTAVSPVIDEFTLSLPVDRRLIKHDLLGSLAHARMLFERGILDPAAATAILGGLSELLAEVEAGTLAVEGADEDVHSWIERQLFARVGEAAGRLHTARSRNDQTAVALRLYTRERLADLVAALSSFSETLLDQAGRHRTTWLPGYTHQQRGQVVSLGHHLLAHFWSLAQDGERLLAAHRRAGVSPLGAGALAGTSHPIAPARSAELLGLPAVFVNSMHAVADRDYVAEALFACALLMVHLSRWAGEVVLWTSAEVGFARLADTVAKGSSLMPQKKNPEAAEIVRGKCGRVVGDLTSLLVTLKGLPLTYNSDLQEDKQALFDALDTAEASLHAARVIQQGLVFDGERMARALDGGFLTATTLADLLVRAGVPFRTAHEQSGHAVLAAEERGCELWQLPLAELRACCPAAPEDAPESLRPDRAVLAQDSPGGPAPQRVDEQLVVARQESLRQRGWFENAPPAPIYVAHRHGRLTAAELP